MRDIRQYKVRNDKEVIFTGVYPGDIICDDDKDETWIVDIEKPYTMGDRALASLIKDAYVIPYTVGGGGSVAPHVYPFNIIVTTTDPAYAPFQVTGGLLTKKDLGTNRYEFTSDDPIDMVHFTDRGMSGSNTITEIEIVKYTTATSCKYMFRDLHTLHTLDLSGFETSNVTDMHEMFRECLNLPSVNAINFDTSKVTDMSGMFHLCGKLAVADVSSFDTSNVTTTHAMFYECRALVVVDVSNFDTSNITDMYAMFTNLFSVLILDVSKWDTSSVIKMDDLFNGCGLVASLDLSNFTTHNVTSMAGMFYELMAANNLDLTSFDMSKVTNVKNMFRSCVKLTCITNVNTSAVTDPAKTLDMFTNCPLLIAPNAAEQTTIEAGSNWVNPGSCP